MSPWVKRRVLLGVTGSIAAYKAAEVVRLLRAAGAEVRVVLTPAAAGFVTPLTFQALSGHPVRQSLLDAEAESAMDHIALARWAELVVVAPASADFLARLAAGLADDLLSTLCLATEAPVLVAPAMNPVMWRAAATRANERLLRERGVVFAGPATGEQACGETGSGRMLEPARLVEAVAALAGTGRLQGRRVLMTAGPTREPVDPVRFLSNRSSGKMGHALAGALAALGARVTLVSGPVCLEAPAGVERVDVTTAAEMRAAVLERVAGADIFVAAAAVADYRPAAPAGHKLKRGPEPLNLALEPTADIVAEVAARAEPPFTVGFAAETRDLEASARAKLARKGLHLVAANPVAATGPGLESDDNRITLYWPGGGRDLGPGPKSRLAGLLAEAIAERYEERGA